MSPGMGLVLGIFECEFDDRGFSCCFWCPLRIEDEIEP